MSIGTPFIWSLFAAFVVAALAVDFFALNRQGAHRVSTRGSGHLVLALGRRELRVRRSALVVPGRIVVYPLASTAADTAALEFLTGYLIEKSLAVDNIFVFLMIFTLLRGAAGLQKRVLMIGIIGAIVLRTVMILVGGWLIAQFHWVLYVFGAFLLLTGIKMWWAAGQEPDLENNPALKLLRRVLPVEPALRRREVLHRRERQAHRHAAARGDRAGGADRRDLRGRFDPGHLRHHHRPVHRADHQRLRHPRPARDVLPARGMRRASSTC